MLKHFDICSRESEKQDVHCYYLSEPHIQSNGVKGDYHIDCYKYKTWKVYIDNFQVFLSQIYVLNKIGILFTKFFHFFSKKPEKTLDKEKIK